MLLLPSLLLPLLPAGVPGATGLPAGLPGLAPSLCQGEPGAAALPALPGKRLDRLPWAVPCRPAGICRGSCCCWLLPAGACQAPHASRITAWPAFTTSERKRLGKFGSSDSLQGRGNVCSLLHQTSRHRAPAQAVNWYAHAQEAAPRMPPLGPWRSPREAGAPLAAAASLFAPEVRGLQRVAQPQALLGTGEGDVEEAALLAQRQLGGLPRVARAD